MRSVFIGHGSALPKNVVTNEDLSKKMDTSDEWIKSRTGITQRHICSENETTSTLSVEASRHALGKAGITADQIDLILVATTTPDTTFPATANLVQRELSVKACIAFDVQSACNGFVTALSIADNYIKTGQVKHALVIGADTFSHILDWDDRSTAVLFGDGAGAVILKAEEGIAESNNDNAGIFGIDLFSDGTAVDALKTSGGAGSTGTSGHVLMNGREVFKYAVRSMGETIPFLFDKYDVAQDKLNFLVPHQANVRIIKSIAKMVNLPMERVVVTVDKHANTSAATIPLALDEAVRAGRIRRGDILLLVAFGAGFAWGGSLVRW